MNTWKMLSDGKWAIQSTEALESGTQVAVLKGTGVATLVWVGEFVRQDKDRKGKTVFLFRRQKKPKEMDDAQGHARSGHPSPSERGDLQPSSGSSGGPNQGLYEEDDQVREAVR